MRLFCISIALAIPLHVFAEINQSFTITPDVASSKLVIETDVFKFFQEAELKDEVELLIPALSFSGFKIGRLALGQDLHYLKSGSHLSTGNQYVNGNALFTILSDAPKTNWEVSLELGSLSAFYRSAQVYENVGLGLDGASLKLPLRLLFLVSHRKISPNFIDESWILDEGNFLPEKIIQLYLTGSIIREDLSYTASLEIMGDKIKKSVNVDLDLEENANFLKISLSANDANYLGLDGEIIDWDFSTLASFGLTMAKDSKFDFGVFHKGKFFETSTSTRFNLDLFCDAKVAGKFSTDYELESNSMSSTLDFTAKSMPFTFVWGFGIANLPKLRLGLNLEGESSLSISSEIDTTHISSILAIGINQNIKANFSMKMAFEKTMIDWSFGLNLSY